MPFILYLCFGLLEFLAALTTIAYAKGEEGEGNAGALGGGISSVDAGSRQEGCRDTQTNLTVSCSKKGLSNGATIGIVVGCLVLAGIVIFLFITCRRKRNKTRDDELDMMDTQSK